MKITICGGGRGGQTLAADFTLMGHDVTLYQHASCASTFDPIYAAGGITLTGNTMSGKNGKVMPKLTTDPAEAVKGSQIVIFAMSSVGHQYAMPEIIPQMEDGQLGLVTTGYFSSLRFRDLIQKEGRKIYWGELELLPYLTEVITPAEPYSYKVKTSLGLAAFPAKDNEKVLEMTKQILPMVVPMRNVLETSARATNLVHHVPCILGNMVPIDKTDADGYYDIYEEGTTPAVCNLMDAVDLEVLEFGKLFGMQFETNNEIHDRMYPNPEIADKDMGTFERESKTAETRKFRMHP